MHVRGARKDGRMIDGKRGAFFSAIFFFPAILICIIGVRQNVCKGLSLIFFKQVKM